MIRTRPGACCRRITFDIEQVAEATTNAVTVLIRDSLTVIFLLAYMFWISGWLTLLFLLIGPVLILLLRKVSKRFRQLSQRIQDSMGELTQFSEEVIHGQRLVKASNGERWQEEQFAEVNERNRKLHMKLAVAVAPVLRWSSLSLPVCWRWLSTWPRWNLSPTKSASAALFPLSPRCCCCCNR